MLPITLPPGKPSGSCPESVFQEEHIGIQYARHSPSLEGAHPHRAARVRFSRPCGAVVQPGRRAAGHADRRLPDARAQPAAGTGCGAAGLGAGVGAAGLGGGDRLPPRAVELGAHRTQPGASLRLIAGGLERGATAGLDGL